MKTLISMALMAMAIASFGDQRMRVAQAQAQHIREVQRARVERIKRESDRNDRIMVEESKKCCIPQVATGNLPPFVIDPWRGFTKNIHNHPRQISSDSENKTKKMKENSGLRSNDPRWGIRNLNPRKFKSSEPARRRR